MTRIAFLLAFAFAATLSIASVQAQNVRSFVSAQSGSDGNPCTRTLPCRTFQHAHDQTNPDGEINTLDPGGYGPVTITKSISIVSGLGEAGVLVPSGGIGITINAPGAIVNLRGLIIEGADLGQFGIQVNSVGTLSIQNSVIRGITFTGIVYEAASPSNTLYISNTLVTHNGEGIIIDSDTVNAALYRVEVSSNNDVGIALIGNNAGVPILTVADSMVAFNGNIGILSQANNAAGSPVVMVRNTSIVSNSRGVEASGAGAVLYLTQSTLAGNAGAWVADSMGQVVSYGDNNIDANLNFNTAPSSPHPKL